MQLSNIARDVGEDARAGRLYLPLRWLDEAGIDPDRFLARPVFDDALGEVVQRLLRAADQLYARAAGGIAALPLACRPAIHASRRLYAEIGREVERQGLDSVRARAVVPLPRKLALLARALGDAVAPRTPAVPAPPLEEGRFLVEAVAAASPWSAKPAIGPAAIWWNFDERVAWLIDLFDRLERRQQVGRSSLGP
jgi:phytoene synthase